MPTVNHRVHLPIAGLGSSPVFTSTQHLEVGTSHKNTLKNSIRTSQ